MTDLPPFDELADDNDTLGWERDRDGRMLDFQTDDDAVETVPYDDEHGVAAFTLRAPRGIGLGLPGALRAMGLTVELVPGWESRSAGSFNPGGAVSHWTAGSAAGDRGSLNVCIHGRAGLPGPLCNVFLARSGVAVVVAAGRANHAGTGGWRGLSGNSAVWGTEAENSGYDAWTGPQRWAYPRVNAAYARLSGFGPHMCCGHSEWTPRKIDINNYTMDRMRAEVSALLNNTNPGDDMPTSEEVAAAVWSHVLKGRGLSAPASVYLVDARADLWGLPAQAADEVWNQVAERNGVGPAEMHYWMEDTRVIVGDLSNRLGAIEEALKISRSTDETAATARMLAATNSEQGNE